jgi:diguanylate cyclase (GGDEF)-like protein
VLPSQALVTPGFTPDPTLVNPRYLTGSAAFVIAGLLLLLYAYRRRLFILWWIAAWILNGSSFVLAGRTYRNLHLSWMVYGISQFLGILGSLSFVVAADAYRHRPGLRRAFGLLLLPVAMWFALAPVALSITAVFAPGHLLIAGALVAAGAAHLLLLREIRLVGALIVGITLIALAGINVWMVEGVGQPDAPGVAALLFTTSILFLIVALGMQVMTFEDMTYELRRTNRRLESAQEDLRQLVITDPLTGCHNRRFFDEVIARELRRHARYETPLSILFLDVDRFKAINDTLGHETGDGVLRQVAAFVIRNVREADFVFRWGGDEFLVLMSCNGEEAARRGWQIQAGFVAAHRAKDLPPGVGLSMGVVEVPSGTADILPLIQLADERMYANKKRKR